MVTADTAKYGEHGDLFNIGIGQQWVSGWHAVGKQL